MSGRAGAEAPVVALVAASHALNIFGSTPHSGARRIAARKSHRRMSSALSAGAIGATSGPNRRAKGPKYIGNLARAQTGRDIGGRPPLSKLYRPLRRWRRYRDTANAKRRRSPYIDALAYVRLPHKSDGAKSWYIFHTRGTIVRPYSRRSCVPAVAETACHLASQCPIRTARTR